MLLIIAVQLLQQFALRVGCYWGIFIGHYSTSRDNWCFGFGVGASSLEPSLFETFVTVITAKVGNGLATCM
jgi:hypothetical protein